MKTIKQIADEIGVTKQAVFKKIKTPPMSSEIEPFISKVGGAFMVSDDGAKLIQQAFAEKPPSTEIQIRLTVALQFIERENQRLKEEVEFLRSMLEKTVERKRWQLRLPWGKEKGE